MPDLKRSLTSRQEALKPAPGGFDRLVRRRRRKEVRGRVAAGTLALVVVASGIFAAATVWRDARRPAARIPIDAGNVGSLKVAWTAHTAGNATTPVAADGLVFVSSDRLYAFPQACGTGGSTCSPDWVADVGGDQPLSTPAVLDGLVFVSTDRLYAFDEHCGVGGATCTPLWTSVLPARHSGFSAPVVADGRVFVSDSGDLYAFHPRCAGDVSSCAPEWIGNGPGTNSSDVLVGGLIYVRGHGTLSAFAMRCGTARCHALWSAPSYDVYGDPGLAFADGLLFIGTDVFHADCGAEGKCVPLWVAAVGAPTATDGEPSAIVGTSVAAGLVYMASDRVYVYRERCGKGGATCQPLWKGPRWFNGGISAYGSWSPPTVASGLVFTGSDRLSAFAADCGSSGRTCPPLWMGPIVPGTKLSAAAVTSSAVFVASSDGTVWAFQATSAG